MFIKYTRADMDFQLVFLKRNHRIFLRNPTVSPTDCPPAARATDGLPSQTDDYRRAANAIKTAATPPHRETPRFCSLLEPVPPVRGTHSTSGHTPLFTAPPLRGHQGQAGWGSEQPGPVEGSLPKAGGLEPDDL